jgi:hypothetical protein
VRPDPELVYAYGTRIGDPVMTGFGAFLARQRGEYRARREHARAHPPALLVSTDELAKATPKEACCSPTLAS